MKVFVYSSTLHHPKEAVEAWVKKIGRPEILGSLETEVVSKGPSVCLLVDRAVETKGIKEVLQKRHRAVAGALALFARYPTAPKRILLSGAHGFVGKPLAAFLRNAGHTVVPLSRMSLEEKASLEEFEGFDAVIHLAGENISSGLWTKKKKEKIFQSRARNTWLLSQLLSRCHKPPEVFICASAIGYYGVQSSEILSENSPPGIGFLATVCKKWEEAPIALANRGVRIVNTRFGVILDPSGGILKKLSKFPVMFGNPDQVVSWIALEDVIGGIYHCIMNPEVSGPMNFTSPHPVLQKDFIRASLRIPAWIVKLFLGQMGKELLLSSLAVYPEKLIKTGYAFQVSAMIRANQEE